MHEASNKRKLLENEDNPLFFSFWGGQSVLFAQDVIWYLRSMNGTWQGEY
jgi:hypothetical protein